jgi:hypothetical protein
MARKKPDLAPQPWRPHWSDSIWLVIVPIAALCFYFWGVMAGVMSAVITVFVIIGIRNGAYAARHAHHSQRNSDKGFWNK